MALRLNLPPLTRILLATLLSLTFLYNLARWRYISTATGTEQRSKVRVPFLALVPASSLLNPWTFLTTTFVEQNVINLVINGVALFYGGKYLERAWGSNEFGKVILVVTLIPNLLATLIYVLLSAVLGDQPISQVTISGGISLQATFLVAFKQMVPEHTVKVLKGLIKMRVKHFVAFFLLVNTLSGFILGTDTAAVLAWLGVLTSWTYLRFYKRQPDLSTTNTGGQGLRGDASETFAFAMFFPDVVQPAVSAVCDQIYYFLVNIQVCTPFSSEDIESGNQQAVARGEAGLPSLLNNAGRGRGMGKREEAERRRALALKALDQRLSVASTSKAVPPPATSAPSAPAEHAALGGTDYVPDDGEVGRG